MGSRRSYQVSSIVGKNKLLTPKKILLTKAIKSGDPYKIAIYSAELIEKSEKTGSYFFYASKFQNFLQDFQAESKNLSSSELNKRLRKEWAKIKKRENIKDNRVLDTVVLDSARSALRGKK